MNLYPLLSARISDLQTREDESRSTDYIHISEFATCPTAAWYNKVFGYPPSTFDIRQSSKVAGGELLEPVILDLFLKYTKHETDAWPKGGLKLTSLKDIPLIDNHKDKLSPTFVEDNSLSLGGRFDFGLSPKRYSKSKRLILGEAKTCIAGDVLYYLWFNQKDILEYLEHKGYALWWCWPYTSQVLLYLHCASITYGRKITQAVILFLEKKTLMLFPTLIDLEDERYCPLTGGTWGEYWREKLEKLLHQAQIAKEGFDLGMETPPPHLWKAANKNFCIGCPHLEYCKPVIETELDEDITDRAPELLSAIERYYEVRGGKKAEEQATESMKERVRGIFPEPKEGENKSWIGIVGDNKVSISWTWISPQMRELTNEEIKSGSVMIKRGYPRLNVIPKPLSKEK